MDIVLFIDLQKCSLLLWGVRQPTVLCISDRLGDFSRKV